MSNHPPDELPRTVRPRRQSYIHRPIIAISHDSILLESMGGELRSIDDLSAVLSVAPSSILAVQGFGQHLQRLQQEFEGDPSFNCRCTPIRRYSRAWDDGTRLKQGMIIDAVCNYVGWRNENYKTNRYHYPIDPIWFLTASIDELDDSDRPRIFKLFDWATQVREWCREQNLHVKASAGGLAAQLLRDPRFYPEPRRKVPGLINDAARNRLPGNYYRLHAETQHYYNALHLDMENAHHALASTMRFPDANTLHAHGHWAADEPESKHEPKAFAPADRSLLSNPGLFHVRLSVPHIPRQFFPPPYMESAGDRDLYVYSNELELIESLGGRIVKVYSAYISEGHDTGLNKYARFAIDQIRAHPEYKPWLKPTLHAAYGLLAARPVAFETGYMRAKGGEPTEYLMGPASIPVLVKRRPHEVESQIANVIHRGMIEAEVRKRALWLARWLTEVYGHNVLAIYADALFVEDTGKGLPLLEPPWRLKGAVRGLRFESATHFTSPTLTRLPGIPRNARERFLANRELVREVRRGSASDRTIARERWTPPPRRKPTANSAKSAF